MDVLRGLMKFTDHPVVGGGGRAHSGQCLPSQLLVVMKCITLHHIIIQPPASTPASLLLQLLLYSAVKVEFLPLTQIHCDKRPWERNWQ